MVRSKSSYHEFMRDQKIAIIGLGYVGLPLSLQFARSGVSVLGVDTDPAKVTDCNAGRGYIKHISGEMINEQVKAGRFAATGRKSLLVTAKTPLPWSVD